MKAVRLHSRGGPELLVYEEAPRPKPGDGEVLVQVHAAAITPTGFRWGPRSRGSGAEGCAFAARQDHHAHNDWYRAAILAFESCTPCPPP